MYVHVTYFCYCDQLSLKIDIFSQFRFQSPIASLKNAHLSSQISEIPEALLSV